MAGYGNADDHLGAQQAHIEDSLALNRSLRQPQNNQTGNCAECGDPIPEGRRQAIPGAWFCADCQQWHDEQRAKYAGATFNAGYMP